MSHGDSSSLFELLVGAARSPDDLQGLWQRGFRIMEASLRRPGVWRRPCRALGSDPTVDWRSSPARDLLLAEGLRQTVTPSYGFLQALAAAGCSPDPWLPLLLRDFLERCRRCHDPLGAVVSLGLRRASAESRDPESADPPGADSFATWWAQEGPGLVAALTGSLSADRLRSRLQALRSKQLPEYGDSARLHLLEDRLVAALRRAIETSSLIAGAPGAMPDLLRRIGPLPEARDWARDHRLLSCVLDALDHLGVDEVASDRLRTLWLLVLVVRERGPQPRRESPDETADIVAGEQTEESLSALVGILRRLLRACEPSEERPESDGDSARQACLQHLLDTARRPPGHTHHRIRSGELVVRPRVPESSPFLWLCIEIHGSRGEVELLPTGPLALGGLPQLSVSTPLGPLTIHCSFPVRSSLSEIRGVPGNPSLPPEEVRRARDLRQPSLGPEPPRDLAATWSEDQVEHWHWLHRATTISEAGQEPSPGPPPGPGRRGEGCLSRLVSFFAPTG